MGYKIINAKKRFATAFADLTANLFLFPFHAPQSPLPNPETIKNILVIRTAYIGDVMMTLPLIPALKSVFPRSAITFLTASSAAPVLEMNPWVDTVVSYDPFWFYPASAKSYFEFMKRFREQTFDLIIEARGDIREIAMLAAPMECRHKTSYAIGGGAFLLNHVIPYKHRKHKIEFHLDIARYFGWSGTSVDWKINFSSRELESLQVLKKKYSLHQSYICAHPGSRIPLKRWPLNRCAEAYDLLMEKTGLPLVIFGAPGEQAMVESLILTMKNKPISLAGKITLRQMAGLLSDAALLLCNDSAPMHIAAAMETPVAAIFGPSKARETGPWCSHYTIIENCFPCRFSCDETHCTYPVHNACIDSITVRQVVKAAMDLLSQNKSN